GQAGQTSQSAVEQDRKRTAVVPDDGDAGHVHAIVRCWIVVGIDKRIQRRNRQQVSLQLRRRGRNAGNERQRVLQSALLLLGNAPATGGAVNLQAISDRS